MFLSRNNSAHGIPSEKIHIRFGTELGMGLLPVSRVFFSG